MMPYNVDIFDKNMKCVFHFNSEPFPIDFDYLYISENSVTVPHEYDTALPISEGQLLYISNLSYWGVVTKLGSDYYIDTIYFKPLVGLFNHEIIYDSIYEQDESVTMEEYITTLINKYWINSEDTEKNYPIFRTNIISETKKWSFKYAPVNDGSTKSIVSFYSNFLVDALLKEKVAINVRHNFADNTIIFDIGTIANEYTIEADLPSVTILEFTIKDSTDSINRLDIYNGYTMSEEGKISYFLHNDGKYDKNDTDRVYPVALGISAIYPNEGESFEDAALIEADNRMEWQSWKNLIELQFYENDALVQPKKMEIGKLAVVKHRGVLYSSMITGKKYDSGMISLIFGKIRNDLTKILKVAY